MAQHLQDVRETAEEISQLNTPDNPVTEHLQRQVANSLLLFINYKHYHWQVYGPQFRDLHLLFDEFAAEMLETFDEFAERLRMIGQDPVFSLDQVRETATVESAKGGHESLREMLEEADRNLIRTIKELRDANEAAEDANDPGTIDLIGKSVRIAEKQEWYFREMLKSGDTRLGPKGKSR
jgi:starvation-inducible DNA-binding protein